MPASNRQQRRSRRLSDVLQLRDSRTDEVTPVALDRPGAMRVHVCATDLRSLLVADLVRRAATLSHDLVVRVSVSAVHADTTESNIGTGEPVLQPADLNIHPAEIVEAESDADVRIGCASGTGLLIEAGAAAIEASATDPLAVRLAILDVDYRKPVDLDDAALRSAHATLSRWRGWVAEWARLPGAPMDVDLARNISAAFDHDLDTPLALQALFELESTDSVAPGAKFETFVYADRLFGLDLARDIR